jgi:superfamily II DNA or RNA helicase
VSTQGATSCDEVPEADVVFLDEAHHYAADEWGRVPLAYPTQPIIGFTATPERTDGRGMGHLFDDLVVVAQPRELVALGHLVDCHILRPSTLHEPGSMCMSPLAAYQHIGAVGRNVVFAATIDHACKFVAEFKMAGIDAALVHGGLAADVRARALESFTSGRVRVLVNVFVLTEGFDDHLFVHEASHVWFNEGGEGLFHAVDQFEVQDVHRGSAQLQEEGPAVLLGDEGWGHERRVRFGRSGAQAGSRDRSPA